MEPISIKLMLIVVFGLPITKPPQLSLFQHSPFAYWISKFESYLLFGISLIVLNADVIRFEYWYEILF